MGETTAKNIPAGFGAKRLLPALIVIVVVCGELPETVAGEKLQPHPLGRPEQAKESDALKPFAGATETINDPAVPCATVSALPDNVSA